MFHTVRGTWQVSSLLTILALVFTGSQSMASKQNVNVNPEPVSDSSQTARFATVPTTCAELVIVSENAKVLIKRTKQASQIVLSSNCPRNWNVKNNVIRQSGFSTERKGTALYADALGSRAVVNGVVYVFADGPMKGLKMGPEGVFINGQKVEPLKGSDVPCNCSGSDVLEVQVPESFNGDLKIGATGKSDLSIDSWTGGALSCTLLGESSLTANKLESLSKAVFDNRGRGKADVSELSTKVFVANISGAGEVTVRKGKAEVSNATVAGSGKVTLTGNFKNMQKMVEGQGSVEVNP